MSNKDMWKEVYQRFDPEQSVPADHPEWRADRPYSPVAEILALLDTPFADTSILLMGTVGTGKTTELQRVAEGRQGHDFVVFLDLAGHFDRVVGNPEALQGISSWEVCFLAGLSLYREMEARLSFSWPDDVLPALTEAWRAAAGASDTPAPSQIDLGKIAKTMLSLGASFVPGGGSIALGIQALGGAADALRWTLPLGQAKKSLPDDNEHVRNMLDRVNRLIGEVLVKHRRVLFVIDGLDRIRDISRARALFVESDVLARLNCPVVVCGPFALRHHTEVSAVRRFQPFALVNEPVLRQDAPDERGEGVAFFWDLFQRRVEDLGRSGILPHELALDLAYRSGGRARDFVKLVRQLALKAWRADLPAATPALVDTVIEEQRRILETGMHRGHIQLLRSVMQDPEHRLPQDPLVWELLTLSRLLPYPNKSEWFYPHPLLTLNLLR